MRSVHLLTVLSLTATLLLGCGKKEETTTPESAKETVKEVVKESKTETVSDEKVAKDASAAGETQAKDLQPLIDKVIQAIKDGKLDDAEKTLKDLEAEKGDAPASTQNQIEGARKSFDAAKAAEGVKSNLPKL
jgi:phage gp29-like protein